MFRISALKPYFVALLIIQVTISLANYVCGVGGGGGAVGGGYSVFTLSIRPSATFCFFNILKKQ